MSADFFASLPEGATPGSFRSMQSTPEIHDASSAGYFQAKTVHTPPMGETKGLSRHGSQGNSQTGWRDRVMDEQVLPSIADSWSPDEGTAKPKRASMEKRASVASIEHFARSKVGCVDLPMMNLADMVTAENG